MVAVLFCVQISSIYEELDKMDAALNGLELDIADVADDTFSSEDYYQQVRHSSILPGIVHSKFRLDLCHDAQNSRAKQIPICETFLIWLTTLQTHKHITVIT